ncbi:hypothetical protein PXD56_08065 [Maribacter sp. SA7]|uniref:hypothetical protein n=1 Tax=Maribacter zhoushanensis TaxID=3030012 RepID=UPI0023EC201F|nr:hypothetical protein [Maribacter zhoushanensis]MDF4202906.1 hypothetical protein [Maribacter zhoushanensis]
MYLFYVYGAGFGHINRVLNFIYTQEIPLEDCVLVTNSVFHDQVPKNIKTLYKEDAFFKDQVHFNRFLLNCIKEHKINTLVVDVFPAGFYGELEKSFSDLHFVKTVLLGRILNKAYFEKYTCPDYDIIYTLENGITLINYRYKKVISFSLQIKPREILNELALEKPYFLVMHSSPLEEVLLLYKQALLYRTDEHIYICSFSEIPTHLIRENTSSSKGTRIEDEVLENATKIFTGCGFNSIIETKSYRDKQHILPFKRRYDDQFLRKQLL